jgi:hypothetical protein
MARFGLLILANGDWDGETIIKDKNYLDDMVNVSQNINDSYGYLWWLNGKNSYMPPSVQFKVPGSYAPNAPMTCIVVWAKTDSMSVWFLPKIWF